MPDRRHVQFLGPSLGAAIVVVIGTVTSTYVNQWQGLLGIIIIACVIGFQGGDFEEKEGQASTVSRWIRHMILRTVDLVKDLAL